MDESSACWFHRRRLEEMQFDFLVIPDLSAVMPVVTLVAFALLAAVIAELAFVVRKKEVRNLPAVVSAIGFALALIYVYTLGQQVWAQDVVTYIWSWGGESYGATMGVVLAADKLSVLFMGLFTFMGLVVSLYSIGYMSQDSGLTQYYVLLMIMVAAMNGVVLSGDLFTLFLFYETMGICSFILVAFRRTWEGLEAAIKYLMMSAVGSTLILYSASYIYGLTGTMNLGAISTALAGAESPMIPIIVALMTAGFGVKGAIVPFAAWLADAHPAAPSGISAMLSGVVIKVGIYGIIRLNAIIFPDFVSLLDWPLLIAIFALITMTAGNFWALTQKDLKRMLAYSSIAQIGLILFAFGTATTFGYQSGAFYIVSHALTKGLLFLCAGAFLHAVGTRDLDDLAGIGKVMPIAGGFFAIGVLSLMGMPPFAGFYAKFLVLAAGVGAGGPYLLFTVIAVFNALLGLGYYLRMLSTIWFKPLSKVAVGAHRSTHTMIIGMGILALGIVFLGIFPEPVFALAREAGSALANISELVNGILNAAGTP
jgi:proton-translocating NADH-quinone oxidoreductase chain N